MRMILIFDSIAPNNGTSRPKVRECGGLKLGRGVCCVGCGRLAGICHVWIGSGVIDWHANMTSSKGVEMGREGYWEAGVYCYK